MAHKLMVDLAEYDFPRDSPECPLLAPKKWWKLWQYVTEKAKVSTTMPPTGEKILQEALNIVKGRPKTEFYICIGNLHIFLEKLSLKERDTVSKLFQCSNLHCKAWTSVGGYWSLHRDKRYQGVLALFGAPQFNAPTHWRGDEWGGGFKQIQHQLSELRAQFALDECEKDPKCREALRNAPILQAILKDLQPAKGLLSKLVRCQTWNRESDIACWLEQMGLVRYDGGKWKLASKALEISICERDWLCKLLRGWLFPLRGLIQACFDSWKSFWSDPIRLNWTIVLLIVISVLAMLAAGRFGHPDWWRAVRIMNVSLFTVALRIGTRLSSLSPVASRGIDGINWTDVRRKDFLGKFVKEKVYTIEICVFAFFLLHTIAAQPVMTLASEIATVQVEYADWMFNQDQAEVILTATGSEICPEGSLSIYPKSHGVRITPLEPLRFTLTRPSSESRKIMSGGGMRTGLIQLEIAVECDNGTESDKLTIPSIYLFPIPFGVRQYLSEQLLLSNLFVLATSFVTSLGWPELAWIGWLLLCAIGTSMLIFIRWL